MTELLCPECHAGKHRACAGFTFDATDTAVPCQCPDCGAGLVDEEGGADRI